MNGLLVTPRMLDSAASNKCVGYILMRPYNFLSLTIDSSLTVNQWIGREASETFTVEQYNEFARAGKSSLMPWLDVDMHTGKVVGHEGRHRAAACESEGVRWIAVAICLRDRGYPVYYVSDEDFNKTFMTKEDCPDELRGQFNGARVLVELSHWEKEFWASRNPKKTETASRSLASALTAALRAS